ncbi:hypothetical protein [Vulcanisaeta thermophila]|uniref:hypothetical protein n=1 Tax=Vulcanisaeta thermophila TaxID=867917 RepID=UPI001EE1DBCE|nr:hypothetical protein [Vulcanisaeta thermophila]
MRSGLMAYYRPPPPPEDPFMRIIRELSNLNERVNQLSSSVREVSEAINNLSARVSNIEKVVSGLVKAQDLASGLTPQSITDLMNLLSSTLRELTRIEASIIAYRDHITSISSKMENSVDLLAKVITDLRDYRTLDASQLMELSNNLSAVSTQLGELRRLVEDYELRILAEYRRNAELIEGLKSVILDLMGKLQQR